MSELIKRVLVAIVAVPVSILIIYLGGTLFFVLVAIISSICLWEFYLMAEKSHSHPNKTLVIIMGVVFLSIFWFFHFPMALILLLIGFAVLVVALLISELWSNKPNKILSISSSISGIFYITLSFIFMLAVRNFSNFIIYLQSYSIESIKVSDKIYLFTDTDSAWFLVSVLITIWICDSAAYFIGKKFGKNKLFERISPKKTWEGAIAGFVFAIISFFLVMKIFIPAFPLIHSLVLGAIIGIVGQFGDLAESQLKRDVKIKDSSAIIPGHGGFLDRFDSILFVMPVVYIYLFFISISF